MSDTTPLETSARELGEASPLQNMTVPAPDFDADLLPLGERALRRVLDNVIARGDEAETDYLEVKGPLEMSKRETTSKIAKFLLGAANRKPDQAAQNFQGHCVLVIGAEKGSAPGVPRGTEVHELEDRLRPYLGPDFPGFEFGRLPVNADNEVLFIIALPPEDGQPMFPCHRDFQGSDRRDTLEDGRIYVRGKSNTRPARSEEIASLIARGESQGKAPINLSVGVQGEIPVVQKLSDTLERMRAYRLREFEKERDAERARRSRPLGSLVGLDNMFHAPLTEEEQMQRLAEWRAREADQLEKGRHHLLGVGLDGAVIHVISRGRFVSKPQLTITFRDCEAVDFLEHEEFDLNVISEPVVDPPKPLGYSLLVSPPKIRIARHPVEWQNRNGDAEVRIALESFRPDDRWTSDRDDFVLVSRDDTATSVSASWVLTEEGNDNVVTGEFTVPTAAPVNAAEILRDLMDSGRSS